MTATTQSVQHPVLTGPIDHAEVVALLSASIAEQLGVGSVAADQNIFDLGVESLMLVDLKEQVEDRFGVSLKFSDFFTHFDIAALSELVVARAGGAA